MIKSELKLRVITSIFLILLLYLMLNFSVVMISSLLLIFVITWIEINNILSKFNLQKFFLRNLIIRFFIFLYLLFFSYLVLMEFIENKPNVSWILIYLVLICILTDLGGYIFGKTFKGKKLTKISPNKTYSGMLGSFLLPLVFAIFYTYTLSFTDYNVIILTTILVSLVSQCGDLFISYLKRKAKVKDTGNMLPGHGGILDRIDGILFAVPFGIILLNKFYI